MAKVTLLLKGLIVFLKDFDVPFPKFFNLKKALHYLFAVSYVSDEWLNISPCWPYIRFSTDNVSNGILFGTSVLCDGYHSLPGDSSALHF